MVSCPNGPTTLRPSDWTFVDLTVRARFLHESSKIYLSGFSGTIEDSSNLDQFCACQNLTIKLWDDYPTAFRLITCYSCEGSTTGCMTDISRLIPGGFLGNKFSFTKLACTYIEVKAQIVFFVMLFTKWSLVERLWETDSKVHWAYGRDQRRWP